MLKYALRKPPQRNNASSRRLRRLPQKRQLITRTSSRSPILQIRRASRARQESNPAMEYPPSAPLLSSSIPSRREGKRDRIPAAGELLISRIILSIRSLNASRGIVLSDVNRQEGMPQPRGTGEFAQPTLDVAADCASAKHGSKQFDHQGEPISFMPATGSKEPLAGQSPTSVVGRPLPSTIQLSGIRASLFLRVEDLRGHRAERDVEENRKFLPPAQRRQRDCFRSRKPARQAQPYSRRRCSWPSRSSLRGRPDAANTRLHRSGYYSSPPRKQSRRFAPSGLPVASRCRRKPYPARCDHPSPPMKHFRRRLPALPPGRFPRP